MVPTLTPSAAEDGAGPRRAGTRRHSMAPTDQLALFAPATPHPVVERLRATDANMLTPLAALQLLAELAERARGEA
jgi:hypothetical protein